MESEELEQDARALLYHIELALDSGQSAEASYFASELAETLWRARLVDLRTMQETQTEFVEVQPSEPSPGGSTLTSETGILGSW